MERAPALTLTHGMMFCSLEEHSAEALPHGQPFMFGTLVPWTWLRCSKSFVQDVRLPAYASTERYRTMRAV